MYMKFQRSYTRFNYNSNNVLFFKITNIYIYISCTRFPDYYNANVKFSYTIITKKLHTTYTLDSIHHYTTAMYLKNCKNTKINA